MPEIEQIVVDYADAAERAQRAGFDFVEVHGAHGYLPSNFLSPLDNRRTDDYGGSLANRARFSLQVAEAIVDVGLPLVWRINGDDGIEGGFALEECVQVSQWLEEAGCAAISVTAGTWHTLHVTLAPMFVPRGHMRHLAAAVKQAVNIPVIAVGRLDDPQLAAAMVADGDADLVLLGRALIAEPDWPRKVEEERFGRAAPVHRLQRLRGPRRPRRARALLGQPRGRTRAHVERAAARPPAPRDGRRQRPGGHGGGARSPGCAATTSRSGSATSQLGGKLEVAGLAPSKREVLRFRDFQARRLAELGVEIHTRRRGDRRAVAQRGARTSSWWPRAPSR